MAAQAQVYASLGWTEPGEVVACVISPAMTAQLAWNEALETVQAALVSPVSGTVDWVERLETFAVRLQIEGGLQASPSNTYTGVKRSRTYTTPDPKD
jgi:hypothetical protein